MNSLLKIVFYRFTIGILLIFTGFNIAIAQDFDVAKGEELFKANCSSCHHPTKKLTGPALKGKKQKWVDEGISDLLYLWVKNPTAALETGNSYVKELWDFDPSQMTPQAVSNEDIDNIMAYVDNVSDDDDDTDKGNICPTIDDIEEEKSTTIYWLLIFAGLLLIVFAVLFSVRNQMADDYRERITGEEQKDELGRHVKGWIRRNRKLVSIIALVLVTMGAVDIYGRLMDVGVFDGYKPEQPIAFSHAIHACENDIQCQYCHNSVEKSKSAGIPTTNICMNCHKNIDEGSRTGKEEIAKIYESAGYDPDAKQYINEEKPIKWVKVHNLPDHVYFNHSQHVSVAGINCEQCHGDVRTFTVGRVATKEQINSFEDNKVKFTKATLTMGWCIECHGQMEVDLSKNAYYKDIHEKMKKNPKLYNDVFKDGKVTVKELGGWECAKCHY